MAETINMKMFPKRKVGLYSGSKKKLKFGQGFLTALCYEVIYKKILFSVGLFCQGIIQNLLKE